MLIDQTDMRRARVYQTLRSAHLERAHQLSPATIFYQQTRYDFDPTLTRGLHLIKASPFATARSLLRSEVVELEVNEPLMTESLLSTGLALSALAARRLLGAQRVAVVTYAIENLDPFARRRTRLRSRFRALAEAAAARAIWKRIDRVVFGTEAAEQLYRSTLPPSNRRKEKRIRALAPACPCVNERRVERDRGSSIVFLGDLSVRKGFPAVLGAWSEVEDGSRATLTILGKGELASMASRACDNPSVRYIADPSRDEIHQVLRESRVLVLPSQPTVTWREQVGLPIVEGLSHGCVIVTTSQTGLSDWLQQRGHLVIEPGATSRLLAEALASAIDGPSVNEILASLPALDGRLEADRWLFGER